MWMLLMLLQSDLTPDARKPVETFFKTQTACEEALKVENGRGNYNGGCYPVTWK